MKAKGKGKNQDVIEIIDALMSNIEAIVISVIKMILCLCVIAVYIMFLMCFIN